MLTLLQVGFLAEWQSYAQQIEGDNWEGDKFDQAKLHKMNGMFPCLDVVEDVQVYNISADDSPSQRSKYGRCMI